MTHTPSTPANPTPPGWPDPLESPQAEAIRNGKLDDTEIRNLFDCMERELRLHRERAANTAQVTDAMVEAAEAAVYPRHERGFLIKPLVDAIDMRAALTAAIGAGGQAVVRPVAWQNIETPSSILTPDQYEMRLPLAKGRFLPLYTHPAPSEQASGAVTFYDKDNCPVCHEPDGQAVAVKALEWEERSGAHYADTAFGEACVDVDGDGFYVIESGRKHSGFASVEAAQAFVQKHHDIWVKDWLGPSVAPKGE